MKLTDIMTSQVAVVPPEAPLRDAAERMADLHVGALPVHDGRELHGIVTDRDIAVRAVGSGLGPLTAVQEVMTRPVVCCREDDPIQRVADLMKQKMIRRVVVLDADGRLAGIVSLADLVRRLDDPEPAASVLREVSEPTPIPHTLEGREAPQAHARTPGTGPRTRPREVGHDRS